MAKNVADDRPDVGSNCTCKVGMLERKYGLAGMDEELLEYWTTEGEDRMSLRSLADHFNKAVLRRALAETGSVPVQEEIETRYHLLIDEETTSGSRTQICNQLSDRGIDVDKLTDEFVSYQTINRHLKNCLGESREKPKVSAEEHVRRRVQYLYGFENKLNSMIEDTLTQLDRAGHITLSDFMISINVNLICSNCGTHYTLPDIVENKGCGCEREE